LTTTPISDVCCLPVSCMLALLWLFMCTPLLVFCSRVRCFPLVVLDRCSVHLNWSFDSWWKYCIYAWWFSSIHYSANGLQAMFTLSQQCSLGITLLSASADEYPLTLREYCSVGWYALSENRLLNLTCVLLLCLSSLFLSYIDVVPLLSEWNTHTDSICKVLNNIALWHFPQCLVLLMIGAKYGDL
jgi:hypothetical protein